MLARLRRFVLSVYARSIERDITDPPTHVAIIQDGNRRYARTAGRPVPEGHRAGARTTERVLEWCREIGIEELTVYAFSTENFNRPAEELEHLFDLLVEKLYEFADAEDIHEKHVRINAIGELDRLPTRVREAVDYAEERTEGYDRFRLNIALAYGGRAELLTAAREVTRAVSTGELDPDDIDVSVVDGYLYDATVRDVDLILRTGGDERTSNFLPWHANGNEAAVCFCTPYWPEFSKRDFLRAIRTYQYREERWRRTRLQRALALLRAFGDQELPRARSIVRSVHQVRDESVERTRDDRLEPAD